MDTTMQPSIVALPTELLCLIIEELPFISHFDFACTCKRIHAASQYHLGRHQKAYRKFRTASDLDPATVPLLLRSAFGKGDPMLAWHVRSFEIWRDRTTWGEWETLSLVTPLEADSDCGPSKLRVAPEDGSDYLEWYTKPLDGELDDNFEEGLEQMDDGHDGLLKALLFAKLPHLQDLKFVTHSQQEGSCLWWMRFLIAPYCVDSNEGKQWPIGFSNLHKVAVGVISGTWLDNHEYSTSTLLLAYLLRLPGIDTIYFNGLRDPETEENVDDNDWNWWAELEIPKHSSSIKHLFLDGACSRLSNDFREALYNAPRELLTIAFRFSGPERYLKNAHYIIEALEEFQSNSLQSLMWYGYNSDTIQGIDCNVSYISDLSTFWKMKQVSFNVLDMELSAFHSGRTGLLHEDQDDTHFFIRHAAEAFPRSMEALVLWGTTGAGNGCEVDESVLFERTVIRLIKDGYYKNLKAIFLEDMERTRRGPRKDVVLFQEAAAAGAAAGIDVHTLTNRCPMRHALKFPEPVDEYDLKTGKHPDGRPSDWVFNTYSGRREPPGCNKCGDYFDPD
ncbi:hypothetical protein BS50DRAFT_675062 [Corynespora cassiicola Philippines]|uniref:F-box domain-containing protein n=1 Tax=Corynespora cassiicola Philippines TaxID=1448308 RepID=A0A2T2NTK6_CORCC|nr:hypothetical protein BS50DRAFT_675062 [Corynespora cassiicola Philippines]